MRRTYDLEQDIACAEGLALFQLPGSNTALGHGGTHGRHVKPGERMPGRGDMHACGVMS